MEKFQALGAPPPDPKTAPPFRISGYAPAWLNEVKELSRKLSTLEPTLFSGYFL